MDKELMCECGDSEAMHVDGERHIIADNSGATFERKAINQHAEVIHQLIETGKFELPEV